MRRTGILLVMTLAILLSGAVRAGDLTSSVDVTFYGYIKVDTIYQQGAASGLDFLVWANPNNLAVTGDAGRLNSSVAAFGLTARQSRFGFKLKGPTFGNDVKVLGKIEGDFYGSTIAAATDSYENKGNFALRIAEIELRGKNLGLLVGNEWMVMSPIFPHVSNYTYQAEIGNLGYRMPQIRLTSYMLDGKFQIQLAADNKIGDSAKMFGDVDSGRYAAVPEGQLGILWDSVANGKPFKLGVTGHYGKEIPGNARYNSIPSYSMNAHFMLPLTTWLSLNGEYYQGANLDGYYTGAQGRGWFQKATGERLPLEDTGGWGEIEIGPISEKVYVYTGYTWDDADDANLERAVSINGTDITASSPLNTFITRNQSYYASVHYWVVPKSTDISLEWMQVDTAYELAPGVDHGIVDRYMLSFWMFF